MNWLSSKLCMLVIELRPITHVFIHPSLWETELRCKGDFQMEKYIFRNIVQCLRERCHLRDTNFVSVEEQVGIFFMPFRRMQPIVHSKGNFSIVVRP